MPRVPSYQTDTINQAPAADTSQNVSTSPETFGASSGRAFQQLGNSLANVAGQLQRRENETWAREQETLFQKAITDRMSNPNTSYFNKAGRKAYDGLKDEQKYYDDLSDSMLESADNEGKRRRLQDLLDNRKASLYDSFGRHAMKEFKAWENSQNQFAAQTAIESAAVNPYSRDVITHLERGRAEVSELHRRNGASEEEVKARIDEYENTFHKTMTATLMQDNPRQAKAYYQANKDNILAETRIALEKQLDVAGLVQQSQEQADLIMEKAALENADPMALAAKIKDPDLRKETEQLVRIYSADKKRAETERENNLFESAWKSVIDNPVPGNVPANIRYDHRIKMMEYIEKKASGKDIQTEWQSYYQLLTEAGNPETRDTFQNRNLYEYRTLLGDSEFKELAKLQAGLKSKDTKTKLDLDAVYSNKQVLDQRLESVGINVNPKPNSDAATRLTQFQQRVDMAVRDFEQSNNKKITADDYLGIVDKMLRKVVVDEDILFSDEKFLFETTMEDIGDVPAKDRDAIEKGLRQNNIPVTDENIKYFYFKKLNK